MHKAIAYFLLVNIFFLSIKCQEQVPVNIRKSGTYQETAPSEAGKFDSAHCEPEMTFLSPDCRLTVCIPKCEHAQAQKLNQVLCIEEKWCYCHYIC
ncbi:hypothetical protein ACET3Z_001778 [Daucus carota]